MEFHWDNFYGRTGTLFISHDKATTSVGDRLGQGSVLRMQRVIHT